MLLLVSTFVFALAAAVVSAWPPSEPLMSPLHNLQRRQVEETNTYTLSDNIVGSKFWDEFDWFTYDDPTHGRVDYVSIEESLNSNLSWITANNDKFFMRADSQNTVDGWSRGRKSNRISSKNTYGDSVVILDAEHLPQGCGTWPAFWTVTPEGWPAGGEIDIIEGANDAEPNLSSLHTSEGCSMPENGRYMSGTPTSNECSVGAANVGCGVSYTSKSTANSFGPSFNKNGGGWYALQRSSLGIWVWFWPRNSDAVPDDVRNSTKEYIDVSNWGEPAVAFVNDQCDIPKYFNKHTIVINLTFCGDWGDGTFNSEGCPGDCNSFVDNNPDSFKDAYWEINSLRTFEPGAPPATSSNNNSMSKPSNSSSSSTATSNRSQVEFSPIVSDTSSTSAENSAEMTTTPSPTSTSNSNEQCTCNNKKKNTKENKTDLKTTRGRRSPYASRSRLMKSFKS